MILANFFEELLYFAILIPTATICFFPMQHQTKRPVHRTALHVALLFVLIIPLAAAISARYMALKIYCILIPLGLVLFILYFASLRTRFCKALSVFSFAVAIMSLISNITSGIDALVNPSYGADDGSLFGVLLQLAVSIAAAAALYFPMTRYGAELVDTFDSERVWYLSSLLSIIIIIINFTIRPIRYETLYIGNIFRAFWAIVFSLLVATLLLAVIFYNVVMSIMNAANAEARMRMLEMQESQFLAQQKYIEETARARHDFKQAIRTLKGLSDAKDYEGIDDYLSEYAEELPKSDVIRYCSNNAVNALLNNYAQSAEFDGIELNWSIDLPERMQISDIDLCSILGNILENATTACRELPEEERWIQLSITSQNDAFLYIVVTNPFAGNLRKRQGKYLSTHKKGHGIGLASITSTVERYGGTAQFSHADNEFYTDIMIPL